MNNAGPEFRYPIFQRAMALTIILCLNLTLAESQMFAFAGGAPSGLQDAAPAADAAAPVDTSPAALDHLLAPIALYPDSLLMQVLAASLNSQEVLDGGNWLLANKSLDGAQIDAAAKTAGFGAAMTALFHFPETVDMMCTQLDWTRQLGAAFNADQAAVLASVQRLRAQAVQFGSLKSNQQQQVVTQTDNGKQVIVIQPANPQIVYVPQYNPQTVYVSSGPSAGDVAAAAIVSFGVGIAVGALFSNNNYYYPRWGYGGVYYGGRPFYPAHYAYRPIYTPYYRPAYGYRPPANYPYHRPAHYNNNYYNSYRNTTVNINKPNNGYNGNRPNNGYYGNKPNNGNNGRPPANGTNPGNKPNNGYNGSKPGTPPTTRPNNGYNGKPPAKGNYPATKPGNGNNSGNTRPNNNTRPAPDRGYTQPATRPAPQQPKPQQPKPQQQKPQQQKPQQQKPASRPAAPAFSGGGNKGGNTRQASQRGAASSASRGPK